LDRPIFPPPETAAVEHLAKAHSYPRWIVRDWTQRCGLDEATRLCFWFNQPQPVTLRVNCLQQSPNIVADVLSAAGAPAAPGPWPESLRLHQSVRVDNLPGFAEGWFSVQDESSMAAARLLAPQPGESVLDLCAAPGGKTTHLAELMQDRGTILAVDQDAERLQRVAENARRLRLNSIECRLSNSPHHEVPNGPFDRVLVDVPCSNTGVLGKRPEARWRLDPHDFEEFAALQEQLLITALDRVKLGGHVVYSTCSIDPRENRQVVDRALARRADVRIARELEHQPGRPNDGGYQALLRRRD
jgi:16S rRNA (cytosine967-C5)-methyltransferase